MLAGDFGDRALRFWPGFGFGSWFEFDRGAQLVDGGDSGQLGVVLIGAVGCPFGDHADLIEGEAALPHAFGAAWERFESVRHCCDGVRVTR
nr:hypothetical protein CPGR_00420 [Mycolicibacter nonchromogenicus]